MPREARDDLRYIKTESLIRQTFRDMLREMDYPQMSVKELTDRARINRKTFYLHYNTLDELLGAMQSELYGELLRSTEDLKPPQDLGRLLRELFIFMESNDEVNGKILGARGNFPLGASPEDHIRQTYFSKFRLPQYGQEENDLITAFLNGTAFFIHYQWTADGKKVPLEEVIDLTVRLVSHGLRSFGLSV